MPSDRNRQLSRVLGLIRDLGAAPRGVLLADLCDRYEVTRRTIERDLLTIAAAGYDVVTEHDDTGHVRKRIAGQPAALSPSLNAEELAAAHAARDALARQAPPRVAAAFAMVVDRLEQSQTTAARLDGGALAHSMGFVSHPMTVATAAPGILDRIQAAILAARRLKVRYRKGGQGEARDYLADPHGVLFGAKSYLVWRGCEDGKFRKFALPHIEAVEDAGESFVFAEDFSLDTFAAEAFGVMHGEVMEVELWVSPAGRARLDGFVLHPSQTVHHHPDNSATVRFRASGAEEICHHLFSWGDTIRIVAPPSLRDAFRTCLERAGAALAGPPVPNPAAPETVTTAS